MSIQILSDDIVNQIAAGEVVERPSHLVKELIENSLDAGATNIEIDFGQGGRHVRIIDDGFGMSPRDLELSIARHATSKIQKSEDLWKLNTFGFRGEALASIAAVSRMKMQSRTEVGPGAAFEIEFGKVVDRKDFNGDRGTRIEVADLFENVPARLKFLRSATAESTAIKTLVKAIAMSRPDVSIRLLQENKLNAYWKATTHQKQRVEDVLEKSPLYAGQAQLEGYQCEVVISAPSEVVQNSRQIWIFVNGRYVQDKNLNFAVLEAYRTFLMHGEYPLAAVFLTCPSEDVDVNVHPTKSQVKFRNPNQTFRVVHHAVRGVLERSPWLAGIQNVAPKVSLSSMSISTPSALIKSDFFAAPEISRHQTKVSYDFVSTDGTPEPTISVATAAVAPIVARSNWKNMMVLGQADLTYIISQNDGNLVLIDQHAAHERVLFERLMHQWQKRQIEVQSLLIPMMIELEQTQVESLLPHLETLAGMGIEATEMGPTTLAVRSLPAMITEESLQSALLNLAEHLETHGGSFAIEKAVADIFATMACHSAIRAGRALSTEEMKSLLEQMDEFAGSSFCPHGRPVSIQLSFTEIERRFGRIN